MDLGRPLIRSIAAVALLSACSTGSVLAIPKTGSHTGETPIVVPYPPPAARVEVIPDPKSPTLVWVDGQWVWKSRRWVWQAGQWEEPLENGFYAPPSTVMLSDGSVAYFPGVWRKK